MFNQDMDQTMKWSFASIWNESVLNRPERPAQPRDHIWASELGSPLVDRYLKMTGVTPTNPPGARSLRKFDAGNIWEWIIGVVLKRSGILIESQRWIQYQYPGLLPVTGKLDFLAGGNPDWDKAKIEIHKLGLPDFLTYRSNAIIDSFRQHYPNGLDIITLEIKSASSMSFERFLRLQAPDPKHKLQAFHYLKAQDKPEAHVVYVCKDDARVLEFGVFNPSDVEGIYYNDIKNLTEYINTKTLPPLEKEILFDHGKFTKNWKVAYSPFLTMLYDYKDTDAFDSKYGKKVQQWNRVFGRVVKGDKITDLNKEVIEDIKLTFSNFDQLVDETKSSGILDLEEEGGEPNE
jgi:hypothetical protein